MPVRPLPQDQPKRKTAWRRAVIRTLVQSTADGFAYIVDFPEVSGGGTEMAFSRQEYDVNEVVDCQWRNESATWWIGGRKLQYDGYTFVYYNTFAPTSQPVAPAGRTWVRIREMLPNARQITSPWANEPTGIDGFVINGPDFSSGKLMLVDDVRFSPDGTRVAVFWSSFDLAFQGQFGYTGPQDAHLSIWGVNSQAERTWGALIDDFRVDIAVGHTDDTSPQGNSESHGIGWSADGKYVAVAVRDPNGGADGTFVAVIGGCDTNNLYLADAIETSGFTSLGAIEFSPNGSHLAVGRFSDTNPGGTAEMVGDMYHFDYATETLTYVQTIDAFNMVAGASHHLYTVGWTPDSQTLFVGIQNFTVGLGHLPVQLGSIAAFPVNPDSTLGPPEYESRQDTRAGVPNFSLSGGQPSVRGLEVHPDGHHVLIALANGTWYVVPWDDGTQAPGDSSRWGWPRTPIHGGSPSSGFGGSNQIFWFDDEYVLVNSVGAGRWRVPSNTTRYNGEYLVEEPEMANFQYNRILKWAQPPKTVKLRRYAPFPDSNVIVVPSALSDEAP